MLWFFMLDLLAVQKNEHSCVLGIMLRGGKTKTDLEVYKHKLFQGISLFASDLKTVGAKKRKS